MRAPPAPHFKGAAWAALFRPLGDAVTGHLRVPSLNGTQTPTAAFCRFQPHRLRATAHDHRNDMGQHRTYQWTHLIRGHGTHTDLTTAQGNHGPGSLRRHAPPQPPPRTVRPRYRRCRRMPIQRRPRHAWAAGITHGIAVAPVTLGSRMRCPDPSTTAGCQSDS